MHGDHCTGLMKISLGNTIGSLTVVQSNFNCQLKYLPITPQDCQEFLLGHALFLCFLNQSQASRIKASNLASRIKASNLPHSLHFLNKKKDENQQSCLY